MRKTSFLFIFGLGYVGQYLGKHLLSKGWRVGGTTRHKESVKQLNLQGFEAVMWGQEADLLKQASHILVTIPPHEGEDPVLATNPNLPHTSWIGYLSATSVYGDHQGAWVAEDAPLRPSSPRAKDRWLAEQQWLPLQAHIFRLAGIYGPGRSVLETIASGKATRIDKPGHVFSRIHVDDIVSVLAASMVHPTLGDVFNVADDEPASTADVIDFGCSLLSKPSLPLIPFEEAEMSPMMREFYADHKRIDNGKIKEVLGVTLSYPTYREGLRACLGGLA